MPYAPRTDEFLVNSSTAGNQVHPNVTRLADGRMLVVWTSPTTVNQTENLILGQFFDADGNKIGGHLFLTDITLRGQSEPEAYALPNGDFVLVWTHSINLGTQVKAQFFNSAGAETSVEYTIASIQGVHPSVVTLPSGSAVIVWTNSDFNAGPGDGSGAGIGGTILAPDGTRQDFSVTTTTFAGQSDPSIALLSNGNFVVTWTDQSGLGGDPTLQSVKGQVFTAAGVKAGGEFLVNTSTAGDQMDSEVTALPSGGFVAVWTDTSGGADASGSGIRGQVFDANGAKVGAEFLVNMTTAGDQNRPSVTVTSNGGFLVTWDDASGIGGDASITGIRGQQFDASGAKIGSEFLVNSVTNDYQTDSALAPLANGDIFAVWTDNSGIGGDTSGSGVKGRIFTSATLGTEGDDTFVGTPGDDEFRGLGGNDTFLLQQGGNDVADGGAGQDLFYLGAAFTAADSVDGGTGNDFLVLQGVYPNLVLTADSLVNVENIVFWTFTNNGQGGATGSPNSFQITSVDATVAAGSVLTVDARQLANNEPVIFNGAAETDGRFFFYGGGGNDYFTGGSGSDSFDGGTGTDTYTGGGGDDVYFVDHPADVVIETVGGGGFDAVYSQVNYVLRAGSEVELLAINGLFSSQPMTLIGNEFGQSIIGATGNDSLNGLGGNDFLTGNQGDDVLDGGSGGDVMAGGVGNDVYFVDQAGDSIQEAVGAGSDAVYATGNYALQGGAEVELLATTGAAASLGITLFGNEFGQSVVGADGNDNLFAGGGNDFVTGNGGNDVLDGGAGTDALTGGVGNDTFRFIAASDAASDIIYDFVSGSDLIDLSTIDANTTLDGNQAFTFIGSNAFGNQAGQLRVQVTDGVAHILGDVNGDGVADLHILAYNLAAPLGASDFTL